MMKVASLEGLNFVGALGEKFEIRESTLLEMTSAEMFPIKISSALIFIMFITFTFKLIFKCSTLWCLMNPPAY